MEKLKQPCTSRAENDEMFTNPLIWADVPDPDYIRVGDNYYMTATMMYLNPGCPVLKSKDLVNWEIVNYVYDIIEHNDKMTLKNGEHDYGRGSWASCIRCHNETFYITFVAYNTNKTYVFQTKDIENGRFERYTIEGIYHDMSLLFDDDGRVYMVYGVGNIKVVELRSDAKALKPGGMNKTIIEKANIGGDGGLPAEGAHIYKLNGFYYIFFIAIPMTGPNGEEIPRRRKVYCYRSDKIDGNWEGRVILDDDMDLPNRGVAQGGIVETEKGEWFSILFQDHGAVGRIPVLVPVTWEDNWPVFGIDGKIPRRMSIPVPGTGTPVSGAPGSSTAMTIVISDHFNNDAPERNFSALNDSTYKNGAAAGEYEPNGSNLALEWQWNHNYDNRYWSLTERPGWLRLRTGSISRNLTEARNTLSQRTFGPTCSGSIFLDVSNMKNGDCTGLGLLQDRYGFIGVKMLAGQKSITMAEASPDSPAQEAERPRRSYKTGIPEKEIEAVPLTQDTLYLKAACDFRNINKNVNDIAEFFYSLDGETWVKFGTPLKMQYRLTHFVGYRFALFNFATIETGGYVDFDYFEVEGEI